VLGVLIREWRDSGYILLYASNQILVRRFNVNRSPSEHAQRRVDRMRPADEALRDVAPELLDGLVAGTAQALRYAELACITHPAHLASTDAVLVGRPHPRSFGTYPRYLGRYVREAGVLALQDCVRRMTSAPAVCFGLNDRGVIQPGKAADMVLFDPATVQDMATFEEPEQFPIGIELVVVNGTVVVDGGVHTRALPGRALLRRVWRWAH
jgi:N-acyl-D-aspartate/D-glutamate deacylase